MRKEGQEYARIAGRTLSGDLNLRSTYSREVPLPIHLRTVLVSASLLLLPELFYSVLIIKYSLEHTLKVDSCE